jgi:hypothetical protein
MLRKQIENWASYSPEARQQFKLVVIDDGSPEPASDVMKASDGARLYRIAKDVAWGRNIARNLGVHVSDTEYVLNIDIDHVLPPSSADELLKLELDPNAWFRFPRWRVGKADETRKKDSIPADCEMGKILPHIDSHLMKRDLFLKSPYHPAYQGFLGGGSPFLKRMESIAPVKVLPDNVCLHVYTRHVIADASVTTLSRDTTRYAKIKKEIERTGYTVPKMVFDFEWSRVF